MDEQSIRQVRESFAQVAALAGPAAILFLGRLLRLDPALHARFARPDMRALGARFIAALGYAVAMLDRPDRLLPAARDLAERLALGPEQRRTIGEALEWMLEECLAEDFTPELRAAWTLAFRRVTAGLPEADQPACAA